MSAALAAEGLEVVAVEKAEPLEERLRNSRVDEELLELAAIVRRTQEVLWGAVDIYESDDAGDTSTASRQRRR